MAASGNSTKLDSGYTESSLSEIFDKCLNLRDNVEDTDLPSVSKEYQGMVKQAIVMLENITHMVNDIGMFSMNETIEEVTTSHIKFLLLPGLLGYFNLKIQFSSPSSRWDQLVLTEEYYNDFLTRLKNYEVPEIETFRREQNPVSDTSSNLTKMANSRELAIKRYKEGREIDQRLKDMKANISSADEDVKREYYMLLLKQWSLKVCEDLSTIEVEKACVRTMLDSPPQDLNANKKVPVKPFKPVILVRTELQKKVFGAGYPSLPTMTVNEFYDQRYPDAKNETPSLSALESLQQMALDPEAATKAREAEDIAEEEKVENDDEAKLQHDRAFDDWKDENRRGCGNRKNMG